MQKKAILTLPCPSTAAVEDPILTTRAPGLLVSLVCDDEGTQRRLGILFTKPRAFRKREEVYCTSWHVADTYDTICEVSASDWVAELRRDAVPEWRDYWAMRHFMIYLDSFGCLEVVAESASLQEGSTALGELLP
jgi:hypothetical protein